MKDILRFIIVVALYTSGLLLIEWVNPDGFTWVDMVSDVLGILLISFGGMAQVGYWIGEE